MRSRSSWFTVTPARAVACRSRAATERTAASFAPQRVLYLIWRDPWMTVSPDTYISRTLALAGLRTLPADGECAARYPVLDDLGAFAGRVEQVLLSSEPYRFRERHLAEVQALVPGARVRLVDGEMTSWYGSRAVRGLAYVRALAAD